MNKRIFPIIAILSIAGCSEPRPGEPQITPSESVQSDRAGRPTFNVDPDNLVVAELKAVPVTRKHKGEPGSVKSRLSFEEKVVSLSGQDLLRDFTPLRSVVPVQWVDLETYSTEYLAQFSPTRPRDRIEPPLPPGTDLRLESRWWAVFDFNGDNVSDWIGLRVESDEPRTIDFVCICTLPATDGKIILHALMQTPANEARTVVFLGRESVRSSLAERQQFFPDDEEIDRIRESFGRIVFWNGERTESVAGTELRVGDRIASVNVSCDECFYYHFDYSWFKYYEAEPASDPRLP